MRPTVAPYRAQAAVSPLPSARAADGPRMYGVLFGDSRYLQQDWDAGMRVREVELSWRRYEPQDDQWSADFVREKLWEFKQARDAGFLLILDFGFQYPPEWAKAISPWKDQYDNTYNAQVNAVWSPEVRRQMEQYIERTFADFGVDFWGIRFGSGGSIETMYPPTPPGFDHSYWAFDADAMASNPVPEWRPGQRSPNDEARRFYTWYIERLAETINWQHGVVRRHYNGYLLQLFAGIGVRPAGWEALIADNLKPFNRIGVDAADRGVVIDRLIDAIADKSNLIIVSTSLGDGFATASWVDESSPDPMRWSSAHWVAYNADRYGLAKWGENTGNNDLANMKIVFKQLDQFGYSGLLWAWDRQLHDDEHASIDDYAGLIAQYP